MSKGTMGTDAWWRHEELVASLPNVVDVGVGDDAAKVTGMSLVELSVMYRDQFHRFKDGGVYMTELRPELVGGRVVKLYIRRRGRSLDVGTRKDFALLGWEGLCDVLDKKCSKGK